MLYYNIMIGELSQVNQEFDQIKTDRDDAIDPVNNIERSQKVENCQNGNQN